MTAPIHTDTNKRRRNDKERRLNCQPHPAITPKQESESPQSTALSRICLAILLAIIVNIDLLRLFKLRHATTALGRKIFQYGAKHE